MNVSENLTNLYAGYYGAAELTQKRKIAAQQSARHIHSFMGETVPKTLLDVGSGDGAVLAELEKIWLNTDMHAVEVSTTGCDAVEARKLRQLVSLSQFDGYRLNFETDSLDLAVSIHVLEHVEHERIFLQEIARVSRLCYIEVPLELTLRLKRAIILGKPYGHINHYNMEIFRNLLETSGLEVISLQLLQNSFDYECYVAGPLRGRVAFSLRRALRAIAPQSAGLFMTYLAGALCRRTSQNKS